MTVEVPDFSNVLDAATLCKTITVEVSGKVAEVETLPTLNDCATLTLETWADFEAVCVALDGKRL